MALNIVALAGGVGGAKLADGLAQVVGPDHLTIVVNTADDFKHLGLHVSPDLDTVMYTLAGVANASTGWGREQESWRVLETLAELGGPTWFQLGDRDLATHLYRTHRLSQGAALSQVTAELCQAFGVRVPVLPMTDDRVATHIDTPEGWLEFQEYFVARRCEPSVKAIRFEGAAEARPAEGVIAALRRAQLLVLSPSNPWVSLDPILAIPGIRSAVAQRPVIGVSPIIAGKALRGPAAKMYAERGIEPSALAVARHYRDLLSTLVVDAQDEDLVPEVEALGIRAVTSQTVMSDRLDRRRLAQRVLALGEEIIGVEIGR